MLRIVQPQVGFLVAVPIQAALGLSFVKAIRLSIISVHIITNVTAKKK